MIVLRIRQFGNVNKELRKKYRNQVIAERAKEQGVSVDQYRGINRSLANSYRNVEIDPNVANSISGFNAKHIEKNIDSRMDKDLFRRFDDPGQMKRRFANRRDKRNRSIEHEEAVRNLKEKAEELRERRRSSGTGAVYNPNPTTSTTTTNTVTNSTKKASKGLGRGGKIGLAAAGLAGVGYLGYKHYKKNNQ